jgi:hypothetical protein
MLSCHGCFVMLRRWLVGTMARECSESLAAPGLYWLLVCWCGCVVVSGFVVRLFLIDCIVCVLVGTLRCLAQSGASAVVYCRVGVSGLCGVSLSFAGGVTGLGSECEPACARAVC